MPQIIIRSIFIVLITLCLTHCGGGGDGGGTTSDDPADLCPQAPDLYKYVFDIHQEALEKLYFNSTWEVTVSHDYKSTPEITRYYETATKYEEFYDGITEYGSKSTYTFTMPPAPKMLACQDVAVYQQFYEQDPVTAKDIVLYDYYLKLQEALGQDDPANMPLIQGSGDHWTAEEGDWYTEKYVHLGLYCTFDNPCPRRRAEYSGCSPTTGVHLLDAEFYIDWYPGSTPYIGINNLIEAVTPEDLPLQSFHYINDNYDVEYDLNLPYPPPDISQDPTIVCNYIDTICLGESSGEKSCGMAFSALDINTSDEVALQNGTTTIWSSDEGSTQVTAVCTSGCECLSDAECDDGVVCTRDECQQGNCVNTPDDTILPEQVSGDCRSCENGEVVSMREQAEDECQRLLRTTHEQCVEAGDNWLLHWVEDFPGTGELQFHYCESGLVGAESTLTICNGAGQCTAGSPVNIASGQIDMSCQNELGESLQFICDVNCASCQ